MNGPVIVHNYTAYSNGKCRCDACRADWNAYYAAYRQNRKTVRDQRILHGRFISRESYPVQGCANCHHPGGLHVIDQWDPRVTHCRVCSACPRWVPGLDVEWSAAAVPAQGGAGE